MAAKHFISISLRDPWTDEAEAALVGPTTHGLGLSALSV